MLFDLTWWPDLAWPRIKTFTKNVENMEDKEGENTAALCTVLFVLSSKNHRRGVRSATYIQGEPKLSDYFVFSITMRWIVIRRSIKDDKIATFMEIYLITVHTTSTKALLCPRPFPHETHFGHVAFSATFCLVCHSPTCFCGYLLMAHSMASFISSMFLVFFSGHQLLRSVLQSGVSLILTRALERVWESHRLEGVVI